MRRRVEEMEDSSSYSISKVLFKEEYDLKNSPPIHSTYAPNPNDDADADADADIDVDAEPMTPTAQTQRPPLKDEGQSAKLNVVIGDDNGGEGSANNPRDQSDGDGGARNRRSNRANSSDREINEDRAEPEAEPNPIPQTLVEKHHFILSKSAKKKGYLPLNVGLYQAALKGDWKTAKSIFDIDPSAVRLKITDAEETALHIAAAAKHIAFVDKLVKLMTSSDLTLTNEKGDTALCFAAASGVVRIAEVMVEKNQDLPNIHESLAPTPVLMAVAYKRKDMASFLFSKTNFEALQTYEQFELLIATISTDYYDIALDILKKKPLLAIERVDGKDETETALHVLAKKPSSTIGSSGELSFWKRHINSRFKGFYNKALMQTLAHQIVETLWKVVLNEIPKADLSKFIRTPSRLLHDAARVGNAEFLIIIISSYPDLLWKVDDDDKSIFHIAVENRQESVFRLIYEIGGLKDFIANYHDQERKLNMLHLAGKIAAPYHLNRVSGAALQMQRELLWFKEVEKIVVSSHLQMRSFIPAELSNIEISNNQVDELTPREMFTKQHKKLLKDGEEWMKNTSNSCMLVATLIATVVFAAAFTVPGGIDNNTGTPIFRQKDSFTVFVISVVIALISSTTSILIFLSILRPATPKMISWYRYRLSY